MLSSDEQNKQSKIKLSSKFWHQKDTFSKTNLSCCLYLARMKVTALGLSSVSVSMLILWMVMMMIKMKLKLSF